MSQLSCFGVVESVVNNRTNGTSSDSLVSDYNSLVRVMVVNTNEEVQIARDTFTRVK